MKSMSKEGNGSVPPNRHPVRATAAQILRQVVVIIVVLAIWSAVLVVYLGLTQPRQGPAAEPEATQPLPAPTAAATPAGVTQVSFSGDVLPIFSTRCERCHGAQRAEAGLALISYADVLAGSGRGPVVIPGSAATSRLVEAIVSGEMPWGGPRLPDAEIQTISDWVDAGALDN
jgi:hypothetical protein